MARVVISAPPRLFRMTTARWSTLPLPSSHRQLTPKNTSSRLGTPHVMVLGLPNAQHSSPGTTSAWPSRLSAGMSCVRNIDPDAVNAPRAAAFDWNVVARNLSHRDVFMVTSGVMADCFE